jgi:hypothetical protein
MFQIQVKDPSLLDLRSGEMIKHFGWISISSHTSLQDAEFQLSIYLEQYNVDELRIEENNQ